MKNLKIKFLTLGILCAIVIPSTSAFAATNTDISYAHHSSISYAQYASTSSNKISDITTKPLTIEPKFNYGPNGGPHASTIVASGGVIQLGDVGLAVKNVQNCLMNDSLLDASQVDGFFGSNTKTAVMNFQREMNNLNNANLTVDGIVGSKTWSYLSPLL